MHVRALPMRCGLLLTPAILTPICGQGAETDAIPAQLAGHVFFVPVYLNNHGPFQFVVDTGATETIVTPATAKAAGIIVRSTPGIQQPAWLIDSSFYHRLWFRSVKGLNRWRSCCDGLLHKPVEQLTAVQGKSSVETESELIEISLQMRWRDGTLVGGAQPAFE